MKKLIFFICLAFPFSSPAENSAGGAWKEIPEDISDQKDRGPSAVPETGGPEGTSIEAAEEKLPASSRAVSGVVRIMRASPETEVFFKDLKDSVIIPFGSRHNEIFSACEQSRKTGSPVHLIIDSKSRRALGVSAQKEAEIRRPAHESSTSSQGSN